MIAMLLSALLAVPVGRDRPKPTADAGQAPQAAPLSDEEVRSKAQAWLGAIDRPISAEQWKSLGPRAAEVLEPIIADPDQFPTVRAKALDGLSAAAPDRAAALAPKIARDEREQVVVRVAALHAAGRVLPAAAARTELSPVLRGRNPALRGEAADVLSRRGGCAAVREQAAHESPDSTTAWKRALARCQ
jgi:hypothetical protein